MWSKGGRYALLACGSFNPPTMMHLRMMEVARDYIETTLGGVVLEGILSPVGDHYGKKGLLTANHRVAMAQAATRSSTWIRTDAWESSQVTWMRTLAVLKHHRDAVRERHGAGTQLVMVAGGDLVDSFPRILDNGENLWQPEDLRTITGDYGLIVLSRDGSDPRATLAEMECLNGVAADVQIVTDDVCPCAVSSTRLRAAIAKGLSLKYATPDEVIDYISEHKLYR